MTFYYDFEQPIEGLEQDLEKLKEEGAREEKIRTVEAQLAEKKRQIYSRLTPWQRVQMARHPMRPTVQQMLAHLVDDFVELHGDRRFRDDQAVITGMGRLDGRTCLVVIQAKGKGTQEKLYRNFGMAHPEGYRKAHRMFEMAERFGCPILCLIDTPGAYPGLAAEERGQAEAIASNLLKMSQLRVPVVAVIVSEGGSGGALGLAVADKIYMLENSIYSVISPEGCSAILWKDASRAPEAAEALKMTAEELLKLGVIDGIVPEPLGGAHRDIVSCAAGIRTTVQSALAQLAGEPVEKIRERRQMRFRNYGA